MNIHENIKRLREEQNLTLEEVGKRTGTTKQTIKRYESGEISAIPYDRIISLAKCFKVTPSYLMGWEDETVLIEVEKANADAKLINADKHLKEYLLKFLELSDKGKEYVMSSIDMAKESEGK